MITDQLPGLVIEALRFPPGLNGWEDIQPRLLLREPTRRIARPDYASTIGTQSVADTVQTVSHLMQRFPEDFASASMHISPEGWRLLFYRSCYPLECLTAFRFHAESELRGICEDYAGDPSADWLGTDRSTQDIADETCYALREAGAGSAMATWTVLAAAQRLDLSKAEVLNCHWWNPDWIRALARRLEAGG